MLGHLGRGRGLLLLADGVIPCTIPYIPAPPTDATGLDSTRQDIRTIALFENGTLADLPERKADGQSMGVAFR